MATIFYSWQSDLPNKINRGFIRDALDIAARAITKDLSLYEEPIIDQDTRGIPGSPEIVSSILTKIDSCSMFIADITLTSQGIPNPNVLIEYGYALKSKGHECIIGVMNDAFGLPDDLPFDLRARRWPIRYHLAQEAGPDMRKCQKKQLVDSFRDALGTAIKAGLFPGLRSVYEDRGILTFNW
jgi:hypothetical protein